MWDSLPKQKILFLSKIYYMSSYNVTKCVNFTAAVDKRNKCSFMCREIEMKVLTSMLFNKLFKLQLLIFFSSFQN